MNLRFFMTAAENSDPHSPIVILIQLWTDPNLLEFITNNIYMDSYTGTFCTFSRICYAHLLRPFYKNYHLYPFNILVIDNCIRKTLTWPVLENFQCGSGIHFNYDSCTSYPYLLKTSLRSPVLYKDYFLKSSKELIMTHWALLLYRAPT